MSAAAELAALLKAPQAGLRLIHLHLGRLQTVPSAEQRQSIRQLLRTLGKQADAWRLFDMANGDLLMLYQGLGDTAAEAACRQVTGLLPDPPPICEIVDVAASRESLLRYLDSVSA